MMSEEWEETPEGGGKGDDRQSLTAKERYEFEFNFGVLYVSMLNRIWPGMCVILYVKEIEKQGVVKTREKDQKDGICANKIRLVKFSDQSLYTNTHTHNTIFFNNL